MSASRTDSNLIQSEYSRDSGSEIPNSAFIIPNLSYRASVRYVLVEEQYSYIVVACVACEYHAFAEVTA